MISKQAVYDKCVQIAKQKMGMLQQTLASLRESAANETKSTAGDKHETALAMLQIEQANTSKQLDDAQQLCQQLTKIDINRSADVVMTGSLVKTNRGTYFISVAIGKIVVGEQTIFALSRDAPLGQKLFGLQVYGQVEVNGQQYIVEEIL